MNLFEKWNFIYNNDQEIYINIFYKLIIFVDIY